MKFQSEWEPRSAHRTAIEIDTRERIERLQILDISADCLTLRIGGKQPYRGQDSIQNFRG